MTNRRNFLKLAGLSAGIIPGIAAAEADKTLPPAAPATAPEPVVDPNAPKLASKLPGAIDPALTKTFNLGKSTYDKGVTMTASHWGVARVHVNGGKIERLEPIEEDLSPSLQLQSFGRQPYNSARIRYPMVRKSFLEKGHKAGGKGRGAEPFVRVSWDKALDLVASELKRVTKAYGPKSIFAGSYGWMSPGAIGNARNLLQRALNVSVGGFTGVLGDYSTGCAQVILPYVIGSNGVYEQVTSWDLIADKCELVVLWGCDPSVTDDIDWCTTVHENEGGFRKVKNAGIPCVAINPLKPDTAEYLGDKCEWIAPRPGTDVAIMVAMCHELDKAGKSDNNFLKKYTVGVDKFREYLEGKTDGVEKTAEWAEKISGVPASKIRELALAMREKRSMLMGGWGIQRALYGEQPHWAMVTLAAFCGHIGQPGGGFGFTYHYSNGGAATSNAPVLPGIPTMPSSGKSSEPAWVTAALERIPVCCFSDCFLHPGKTIDYNGKKITYPDIKFVFWSGGNPMAQQEDVNQVVKAWQKPEVTVVTDIMWTASARHADIVLPACTALERNDITSIGSYSNLGFVAMQKAIEPQWDSLSDFEIYRRLAAKLGHEKEFTEGRDEMAWVKHFYESAAQESAANGVPMPSFDEFWKSGLLTFPIPEENRLYNYFGDFRKNPITNPLGTPSGKIEIYSKTIASYGYKTCPPHPTWMAPTEWLGAKDTKGYPFALLTAKSRYRLHSQLDSTSSNEYADIQKREPLWIHPDAAKKLGLKDGDIAKVSSRYGAVLTGVYITDRVRPDVVVVHHGAWYCPENPGKPGSLDLHGCDNVLTSGVVSSPLSCGNVANSWMVKVEKYKGKLQNMYIWDQPPQA